MVLFFHSILGWIFIQNLHLNQRLMEISTHKVFLFSNLNIHLLSWYTTLPKDSLEFTLICEMNVSNVRISIFKPAHHQPGTGPQKKNSFSVIGWVPIQPFRMVIVFLGRRVWSISKCYGWKSIPFQTDCADANYPLHLQQMQDPVLVPRQPLDFSYSWDLD
jgi:hypothetical protein